MSPEQINDARETGRKVWESLRLQMAEAGGFFSAMVSTFRLFTRRYLLSLLIAGAIAAALSAAAWFVKPRSYESEMTLSYVHFEKKIYADMIRKLNLLAGSGSHASLAAILGMPEEKVSMIRSIGAYNIRNEDLSQDLSTEKVPFYIRARVADISILPELQTAIVNYLNSPDYIRDRVGYMRKKSLEDLAFYQRRMDVADSLSSLMIIRKEGINDEKAITRLELLQEVLTLHDRIQHTKGSLEFNQNIEVLDGFVPAGRATGSGLITWIIYGFLAGLGLRWLVLLFR